MSYTSNMLTKNVGRMGAWGKKRGPVVGWAKKAGPGMKWAKKPGVGKMKSVDVWWK